MFKKLKGDIFGRYCNIINYTCRFTFVLNYIFNMLIIICINISAIICQLNIYNYAYTNYLNKNILFLTYPCKNMFFVHLIPEKVFELIPSKSK